MILYLCDTQLVGEISLPMLQLHDFESMVKMFTFSLLTLHKTTSYTAGNVYPFQGSKLALVRYPRLVDCWTD